MTCDRIQNGKTNVSLSFMQILIIIRWPQLRCTAARFDWHETRKKWLNDCTSSVVLGTLCKSFSRNHVGFLYTTGTGCQVQYAFMGSLWEALTNSNKLKGSVHAVWKTTNELTMIHFHVGCVCTQVPKFTTFSSAVWDAAYKILEGAEYLKMYSAQCIYQLASCLFNVLVVCTPCVCSTSRCNW